MNLSFDQSLVVNYKNQAQKIRVLTESWVAQFIFCPNCGKENIDQYPNNRPVGDFYCLYCSEEFELKSKQKNIGSKIVDGAYHTMVERISSRNNPNFFLLNYDPRTLSVINFVIIPKHFFVPNIIERRKPLSQDAIRAGWVGCNILLNSIPQSGKIFFVRNQQIESRNRILEEWRKTIFLREETKVQERGWFLDIMRSIERLNKKEFKLEDIYAFERELSKLHPENKHIKDKIRQQLQVLRDKGYLDFVSRGYYRLI